MDPVQRTWHSLPVAEIAGTLGTDLERGLTSAEATARQKRLGPNELVEREGPAFWQLLLDQFRQFLVIILIVAAVISFALGEWLDGGAILAIVILNAVIGVVQESKAEQALAALKKLAAPEARVVLAGSLGESGIKEFLLGSVATRLTAHAPCSVLIVRPGFRLDLEPA